MDKILKIKQAPVKMFEEGQAVVLLGTTKYDREIFIYKNPTDFITKLRISEENKKFDTNAEFMKYISTALGEENITIPFHSEEVFIKTLIKIGICIPAVLN